MKKNTKKVKLFLAIMIICALLIIGFVVIKGLNTGKSNKINENPNIVENEQVQNEEYVEKVNEDIKLNISPALKQDKKIEGLTIKNIQLTTEKGVSLLLADVENTTNSKAGDFGVLITALDKSGNEILKVHGYISSIEPGETTQLSSSITEDYANAYDFKIEKE